MRHISRIPICTANTIKFRVHVTYTVDFEYWQRTSEHAYMSYISLYNTIHRYN